MEPTAEVGECTIKKTTGKSLTPTVGLDQKGNRKPGMVSETPRHTQTNEMLAKFITDV